MRCEREGEREEEGRQLGFEGGRDNHHHPVARAVREEKRRDGNVERAGAAAGRERERAVIESQPSPSHAPLTLLVERDYPSSMYSDSGDDGRPLSCAGV